MRRTAKTSEASTPSSFVGHARTVAGLTLVSRISGLVRDAVCARVFGTSAIWSAFVTAFMIPNLFRRLFGEGALSAAFIPRYTTLLELADSPDKASDRFASLTVGLLFAALGGLTALIELVLLAILLWSSDGEPGAGNALILLTMLMLPYMPLVCVTAILGGILQVHDRFGPHAAAPVLLNLAMTVAPLVGVCFFDALEPAAILVAISVTLAGVVQCVWCFWTLRGVVRWRRSAADTWGHVREMLLAMLPVIVGLGALQLSSLVDALIAGYPLAHGPTIGWGEHVVDFPLAESSAAVLYFAQRLYQFPLGVFGIAIATAVFPALSRAGARLSTFASAKATGEVAASDAAGPDDQQRADTEAGEQFLRTLREGVRLSLFIACPATLGLVAVREPLTAALYAGGDFVASDVSRVAAVLSGYAMAIWAYALTHVLTRSFYALGDMKTPMWIGLRCVVASVVLKFVLIWPLGEAGLAWATTAFAIVQAIALCHSARRRFVSFPGSGGVLLDSAAMRSVLGTVVCSALMFGALLVIDHVVSPRLPGEAGSWAWQVWRLAVLVATGMGLFAGMAAAGRLPELGWVLHVLRPGRSGGARRPDKR
jgi:putative peptidoglycan lipid II flippase